MSEKPILFSGEMVRALLDGRKTQTRRIVKHEGIVEVVDRASFLARSPYPLSTTPTPSTVYVRRDDNSIVGLLSPYGKVGDQLWVRETFYAFGRWETRFSTKKGRDEWHFVDMTVETDRLYQFDTTLMKDALADKRNSGVTPRWWKRPAIFMPRAASRITLDINDTHVEKLQEISYEDAIAEGVYDPAIARPFPHKTTETVEQYARRTGYPQRAYRSLWVELNGHESWDANPFVWVISFKVVKQ